MKKAAILLVLVMTLGSCSLFEKPSMTQEEIDELVNQKAAIEEELVNLKQQHELLKIKAEECAQLLEQQTTKKKEIKGKYCVVVGSFKNLKYAEDYSQKVIQKGGLGEIVSGPYDFNLVVSSSHSTLREAAESMYTARNEYSPEAWVYMVK